MRLISLLLFLLPVVGSELLGSLEKLKWLVGTWRSEFSGKIVWPTVPTMTYGEELQVYEAPFSAESGVRFLNFTARSWSHSTQDHFLDVYGYLTVDSNGNATLITTGNNGFSTVEQGKVGAGLLTLQLKEIGRISIAREIPVRNLKREIRRIDDNYLEQAIQMKTTQHPRIGMLEHARVLYEKVRNKDEL